MNKSSLTYLRSYLLIVECCKNYGGNLPSVEALSSYTSLSPKTIKRHLLHHLCKEWIRINPESPDKYTIVSSKLVVNVNDTKGAKGVYIPSNVLNYTTQQFTAYLAEVMYESKHYFHLTKEKNELKRLKSFKKSKVDTAPKYGFNRFYIDNKNRIYTTKSYISKTGKLRIVHLFTESYIKDGQKYLKTIPTVKWVDYKNIYTCKSLDFVPYKFRQDVIDNLLLVVQQLTQISMINIQESEESVSVMQQSLSYRACTVSRSKATIKAYQSYFSERYVVPEAKFITCWGSVSEAKKRNDSECEYGKYICLPSKVIIYVPCTKRQSSGVSVVRKSLTKASIRK